MNEQRYIRWKTTPLEGGLFALQITEQSHRDFKWDSSIGLVICSGGSPRYTGRELCVQGGNSVSDYTPIILNADQLEKCERALTEYNFAHSEFAEEWEIVGWRGPVMDEMVFYDDGVCKSHFTKQTPFLVVRRKQPPVPTGEACVGCLCWVWDLEDQKNIGVVMAYNFRYKDIYCSWWSNAIPLTPEEVEAYLAKSKEAWKNAQGGKDK